MYGEVTFNYDELRCRRNKLIIKELKTKSESGWIEVKENNFTPDKVKIKN